MNLKQTFAIPGTLTLGGREFVVPQPSASDLARVHEQMRTLASAACVSPIAYVNANAPNLHPAVFAESVRAAVAMGSGGGAEPTPAAVARTYDTLEGVRWRVWYFVHLVDKSFTLDDVRALVTEENRFDVSDALFAATSPGTGADAPKAPPGGAN